MLKIKDNVNLKQLEKYGFKKNENDYFYDETGNLGGYDEIFINAKDRIIQLGFEPCPYFMENCLYDLIKDGLVEKVNKCHTK